MIAAKQFDPVVGIDIHITQPPGTVPPVPVPHPFVGILMDPFDFVPIVGGTVMVNGIPRATAGTGGKCVPPHIPIGGMFVKPPGNECEVFMGSSTVLADGEPLSSLGMPALSCHDIGMPPPPRLKKKRVPKSLFLPTSVVLSVPAGAPVLVGGPPTVSMMALGMKAAMAGLGKSFKKLRRLQKSSRRMKALSHRVHKAAQKAMDKLGVPPSIQNRVHRAVCTVTGHPVDVATGKVFTEAADFGLPGLIPFRWERVWYSSSVYDGPLGHGWHHEYDMALWPEDGVVAVRLGDGRSTVFSEPVAGASSFDRKERLTLRRERSGYILEDGNGLVHRFAAVQPGAAIQKLGAIEDRNGNRIVLRYDAAGRLAEIIDSAERRIRLQMDSRGRITSLLAPHPQDPGRTMAVARYCYDEHGDLVEVRDALGHSTYYAYAEHLLVRETDRLGISFHFEYTGSPEPRCLRTRGDGGIFERTFEYDLLARRTIVTDARGARTAYYWNEQGLVELEIDAAGRERRSEYDEDGLKIGATNELGKSARLEHDDLGRLIRAQSFGGAAREFLYDDTGNNTALIDEVGERWLRTFDARGNVTSVTDPLGAHTQYVLDRRGLPETIIDPLGRETKLQWDASGNIARIVDRTGGGTSAHYDLHGRLVRRVDAEGGEISHERDALGRIVMSRNASHRWHRFRYDAEGNVIEVVDPVGRARTFEYGPYGPGGRLMRSVDANGDTVSYDYDKEGDLARVVDPARREWLFQRDPLGNVIEERDFIGRTLRYTYDAARRLAAVTDAVGRRSELQRDDAGRLTARVLADGMRETFAYDPLGRIVQAVNDATEIEWSYDARGRLVSERQGDRTVTNTYDACGRRLERRSPAGRLLGCEHDAEGRLRRITHEGQTILQMRRNAIGREVGRQFLDLVESTRAYSTNGELIEQKTVRGEDALLLRRYRYDDTGMLDAVEDSQFGLMRYAHDAAGRLVGVGYPDGRVQRYRYDRAGNSPAAPLRLSASSNGSHALGETVHISDGWTLRYDTNGCLVAKQRDGVSYRYAYDAAGRLNQVTRENGEVVHFAYDAVGRRVLKDDGHSRHHYAWDGDALIAETIESDSGRQPEEREYYFDQLRPLLAFRHGGPIVFECDQIGAPNLALDAGGNAVWRGSLDAFGEVREEIGDARVDFRFPGQQADPETGLIYNRLRYYDPALRTYTQPDPVKLLGGLPQYNYVPSPIRWIDPYGLEAEMVDPDEVNFSQRTVADNDYQKQMEADDWDWDKSGPVRVTEVDGQLVTYDNRRLDAARGADNVDSVPVHRVDPDSVIEEWDPAEKKFKPVSGAKKTWRQAFDGRRNDPRNKKAGGVVPEKGLPERPTKVC